MSKTDVSYTEAQYLVTIIKPSLWRKMYGNCEGIHLRVAGFGHLRGAARAGVLFQLTLYKIPTVYVAYACLKPISLIWKFNI